MTAVRDLRHAWRAIGRMPLMAAVVVVSLGIGIGVNASVFTWIQATMLDPVPGVAHGGRLLLLEPRSESGGYPGASWREFGDLRGELRSFRSVVAFRGAPFNVGDPANAERSFGQLVSGNFFTDLGLQPAIGRLLADDDARRSGANPVVVISHDYWQTHFAGRRDVVGQPLRVNGAVLTIVGVAPERFQGTIVGLNFDLWAPATMAPALVAGSRELEERGVRGYSVIGDLAPGRTLADASGEIDVVMRQLADAYPESNRNVRGEVLPFWWSPRGPQRMLLPALGILQGVMALVLLAVCGNMANLMLARAGGRRREMAIRLTLGARRWRVARLVLVENVGLGLAGGTLGLIIALWGTSALRAMPLYGAFPIRFETAVDGVTIAFALGLGTVSGVLFGLAPAWQLANLDAQRALKSGSAVAGRSRLSRALMAIEVALALIVLIAGGLFLQKFTESQDTDPHFRRDRLYLAAYDLQGRNLDGASSRLFAQRLLDAARGMAAVDTAGIATSVPLDIHGLPVRTFTIDGRARSDGREDEALSNTVTPGYLGAMGIALKAGRDFAEVADTSAPAQVIVNDAFARTFLSGSTVVGRALDSRGRRYVIVGVSADSTYESFGEAPRPIIYFSYRDRPAAAGEIHLYVKPGADPGIGAELQRAVRAVDPAIVLYNVRTMPEHIERNLFLRRIPARMFMVLGPLLLALAALGIYAVVSYGVSQRTREIAVRLALGADRGRVVAGIVGDSLKLVLIGAAVAWLMAYDVYRRVAGGGEAKGIIFIGVPLVLVTVAAAAAWVPARRAGRIDPAAALKE